MAATKKKECVDCIEAGIQTRRPAPNPGPRCASHWRATRKKRSKASHGKYVEATYNITSEMYWAIYEAQGGKCAICERATGATRKLAVDHDHSCCAGATSCGKCVRSLLCKPCNRMLGHMRDDPEMAERAADYLRDPPGRKVLDDWNAQ